MLPNLKVKERTIEKKKKPTENRIKNTITSRNQVNDHHINNRSIKLKHINNRES
jgi:hypothetical protein